MKAFFSALAFLTPLRVPPVLCGDEHHLRKAPVFFPAVGALIGGTAAAVNYGLDRVLPPFPASVLVVLWLVAASGGLHLDGLADTADGFFSARPRDRVLEIMRDSHIGTMGVAAVVGVLLLKVSLLSVIGDELRLRAVFLAPLAGRSAALLVLSLFRYARPGGGLATIFGTHGWQARLLAVWAVAWIVIGGWLAAASMGLAAASAAVVFALLLGCYARRRVGGYTGDTLGATTELVEVVPFLVAALWPV